MDGRLATIEPRNGTLHDGPGGWGGGGSGLHRKPQPVHFETQGESEQNLPGQDTNPLSRPEIERRTLPGHTTITGTAEADVVSITLATPRDVRTLRPSGPRHAFIVVYDGQFFRGEITATIALRDGRIVTEPVPNSNEPGADEPAAPRTPPLAKRLQSDETTLKGMRTQVADAEHAGPRRREKALDGAPLAQIVHGLRQIEAAVAADQGRIAFIKAHPGVLPAE